MEDVKLFEQFSNNKVWCQFPVFPHLDQYGRPDWNSIPKDIGRAARECIHRDEIENAFQLVEVPSEKEYDQYDEPHIKMAKFLRENGFVGKYILVDNRW